MVLLYPTSLGKSYSLSVDFKAARYRSLELAYWTEYKLTRYIIMLPTKSYRVNYLKIDFKNRNILEVVN